MDSSKGTLNPFADNIILAALYGRCLTHRRLAIATALNGKKPVSAKDSNEFCRRHEWLAAAVERRIVPLAEISLDPCDPMATFGHLLGRSATIYLSDTAATWPWQSAEHHMMITTYEQRAYQAAIEIVQLACALPRLSYLKVSRPNYRKLIPHTYTCARLRSPSNDLPANTVVGISLSAKYSSIHYCFSQETSRAAQQGRVGGWQGLPCGKAAGMLEEIQGCLSIRQGALRKA